MTSSPGRFVLTFKFGSRRRSIGRASRIATIILQMELAIQIRIEQLPEGLYLATSDELPGLVAQGRTVAEALDIARDVARKIIEASIERGGPIPLASVSERRAYTLVVPP